MEKLTIIFIATILIMFSTISQSYALRCNCGLVSIGDRTFVVLKRCGEPVYKEIIREGKRKQPKLENWVYGPIGGMYHYLIFKDGKLFKIESFRK